MGKFYPPADFLSFIPLPFVNLILSVFIFKYQKLRHKNCTVEKHKTSCVKNK